MNRPVRLTGDMRREQILDAATRCFAQQGYAATTTRSVAAAAGVSEALLFKHFPTKAALYAEIQVEMCERDSGLIDLQALEPSTSTLVRLVRETVSHFVEASNSSDSEDAQRIKLMVSSHLEGGEFARLLFGKVGDFIEPIFAASLSGAAKSGDITPSGIPTRNLFWFMQHTLIMLALTRLPLTPTVAYLDAATLERQICEFILRGIGVTDAAIAAHLADGPVHAAPPPIAAEA